MPESEVALRLAFHLLELPGSSREAEVAIDGAQVRVHGSEVFPLASFLAELGWRQVVQEGKNDWHGTYERGGLRLTVHSRSGLGDVVCSVAERCVRAECKKGPLIKKKGSREYPLLREALGQILTVETVGEGDVLAVAVPRAPKFVQLAKEWRGRPLVRRAGIHIVLVGRDGTIEGLEGVL